jgi:kumamolisin
MHQAVPVRIRPYVKLRPWGTPAGAPNPWRIPDLCSAYHWPANLAGGGVIALVECAGGWLPADMQAYFTGIGQPVPGITDVTVGTAAGNRPNSDPNADTEVALDIQAAAASYFVATGKAASIRVYWAGSGNDGITNAIHAAAADGCDVCSISWGSDEANWCAGGSIALLQAMEQAAANATANGMVVLAAAGDNDSSDGGPTPANVDAPASCPHVIGCGGTSKTPSGETVWNDNPGKTNGSGTGGGYSTVFAPQPYQLGAPTGAGRMVPDIAAHADPDIGIEFQVHGAPVVAGGTSAVAPLYAGLFAAFGRKLGFIAPRLWSNPMAFVRVTQGDNGAYHAGVAPSPCTGLGAPVGTALAGVFKVG